jgi:hypothetical protein
LILIEFWRQEKAIDFRVKGYGTDDMEPFPYYYGIYSRPEILTETKARGPSSRV